MRVAIDKYEQSTCPNRKHHPDEDTPCLLCCDCEACADERAGDEAGSTSLSFLALAVMVTVPVGMVLWCLTMLSGAVVGVAA